MEEFTFTICTDCGFMHSAVTRKQGKAVVEQRKHEGALQIDDDDPGILPVGTIVLDSDGDCWQVMQEPTSEFCYVYLHPVDHHFSCDEFADVATDYGNTERSRDWDGAYAPYYIGYSPIRVPAPPAFASVEEAEAWMEAHS